MVELSRTMDAGLRAMAKKLRRNGALAYILAEPNDNTGRALERRGLLAKAPDRESAWSRYRLTEAGWAYVNTTHPTAPATDRQEGEG